MFWAMADQRAGAACLRGEEFYGAKSFLIRSITGFGVA
jgi:hypothetical protein